MNKTHRIKVLGLLSLPLLAVALAVMVFAWGSSADTAEAETGGAVMGLRVDAADTQICPGTKVGGETCVALGNKFNVIVSADEIPLPSGYILAQAWLTFGNTGLTTNIVQDKIQDDPGPPFVLGQPLITATVIWPNCVPDVLVGTFGAKTISAGCLTGVISTPPSFYKGDLYSFSFKCTTTKSQHVIDLETLNGPNAGTSGAAYKEGGPSGATVAVPAVQLLVNCTNPNTPTPTPTDTPTPTPTPTNTPAPIPRMQKSPLLQNVFLTRQNGKIPPPDCLAGTNIGGLTEQLSQAIVSADPKGVTEFQTLAAFEFEVHYDATKVCVTVTAAGDFAALIAPFGAVCVNEDSRTKPQLEGVARIGCVTFGKGYNINELEPLAQIDVYPQPDVYSQAKPNQDNGVVVQINNVDCDLSDEQGHAIPIFSCDDADITFRYLEGDVDADCDVDALDATAIAFRWGSEKGSLVYKDFMNLEPSGTQSDNDIDINDLQFVYGRFGSSCGDPHPVQDPVNPKA